MKNNSEENLTNLILINMRLTLGVVGLLILAVRGARLPKLIAGNWKMNPAELKTAIKLAYDVARLTRTGRD